MTEGQDFYLDFNVTGSERKRLVNAISEHVGEDAHYLGAPTFAYEADYFTIDKSGRVSFDDRADSEEIEGLIEFLANQGFVAVESHLGLPEDTPAEETSADTDVAESGEITGSVEPVGANETPQPATPDTAVEADEDTGAETAEMEDKMPPEAQTEAPTETESDTSDASAAPELPAHVRIQLETLRASLIRDINRNFEKLLRSGGVTVPQPRVAPSVAAPGEIMTIPLLGDTSMLRGTKPVAVKYNNVSIPATSWKKVFAAVLDICNRQEAYHQALLQARETVAGRGRKFISASPQGMYSPLRVDDGLYVETNFSTEALLKFLKDRILAQIGFDASGVTLEYRHP